MAISTLAIIALAFSLDLLFGDPRPAVAAALRFDERLDDLERDWRTARGGGLAVAGLVPLAVATVAGGAVVLGTVVSPVAGGIVAGTVLFLSTDLRQLLERVSEAVARTDVGQTSESTNAARTRSTALGTAATDLSHGLFATLLPFAFLGPISLPAAAAVVAWIRSVETLGAAFANSDRPLGAPSVRLRKIVMWLPDRLTAVCIATAAGNLRSLARTRRLRTGTANVDRRTATNTGLPAPTNANWPVTTLAVVLSVRLESPDGSVSNPEMAAPSVESGEQAITLLGLAAAIGVVLSTLFAVVGAMLVGPPEPILLAVQGTAIYD